MSIFRNIKLIVFLLFAFAISSCGKQFHLPKGKGAAADSSYIYALPYPKGKSHFLVQGYRSWFSHKGRLALDFKMKNGSPIHAARSGVVASVQESFTKGGVSKKYYRKANSVIIRHSDGTQAFYGHIQHNGAVVNAGDIIEQGQLIAYSGSTGYSAMSHVHFIVWGPTPKGRSQLPTRFYTAKGVRYLKPGRFYRAVDAVPSKMNTPETDVQVLD